MLENKAVDKFSGAAVRNVIHRKYLWPGSCLVGDWVLLCVRCLMCEYLFNAVTVVWDLAEIVDLVPVEADGHNIDEIRSQCVVVKTLGVCVGLRGGVQRYGVSARSAYQVAAFALS